MTLADRIAVLDRGRVQQVGKPEELYQQPANRFVASFIGSPSMNLFETELNNGTFSLAGVRYDTRVPVSGRVTIGIRPEALRVESGMRASVSWIEALGAQFLIGTKLDDTKLTALVRSRPAAETLEISFDPADIHVFDIDSGKNLRSGRH
jgi:ABC-type sugar transport system ATPase subunit